MVAASTEAQVPENFDHLLQRLTTELKQADRHPTSAGLPQFSISSKRKVQFAPITLHFELKGFKEVHHASPRGNCQTVPIPKGKTKKQACAFGNSGGADMVRLRRRVFPGAGCNRNRQCTWRFATFENPPSNAVEVSPKMPQHRQVILGANCGCGRSRTRWVDSNRGRARESGREVLVARILARIQLVASGRRLLGSHFSGLRERPRGPRARP